MTKKGSEKKKSIPSCNTMIQLQRAIEIVDRYVERGHTFPRELRDCGRSDPHRQQGKIYLFDELL